MDDIVATEDTEGEIMGERKVFGLYQNVSFKFSYFKKEPIQ